MTKILALLLVFSFFVIPVNAQSPEDLFWDSLGMNPPDETESYSDYYLSGYQDGYEAGYQAGFAMGLESATKLPTKHSVSGLSPAVSRNNSNLKPVTTPTNGKIFKYPSADRLAPLTIHTTGDKYYYFSLRKVGSSDCYMSFFGHGGKTVDVDVPFGVYQIYYATGETWYGTNHLFGPDTSYYRCSDFFSFRNDNGTYKGWELTLYPVEDGNMDSESVSVDDFPK